MNYIVHLPKNDSFYEHLCHDILPQLGVHGGSPEFRVYKLPASNHVYLYEDQHSEARVIGKFFGGVPGRSPDAAFHHMEREFNNLNHLRSLGFTGYPHYVVRPLGCNASLNNVLVEEVCYGTPLADFILQAIGNGARDILFQKLTALAYFLATLHQRTANGSGVDFNKDCAYFEQIMQQLINSGRVGSDEAEEFHHLKFRWHETSGMWQDRQVLVHGDVTPANILFGDGLWVIAIDLERMKPADRVFDLGRVVGELQHFFMQYARDKSLAEPFIGHFLWEYACHFPNRDAMFAAITQRAPFHIGLTLLRIARNAWISGKYSRTLIDEAKKTLR